MFILSFIFFTSISFAENNKDLLERLLRQDSAKVLEVFKKTSSQSSHSATYEFPEVQLGPQEVIYFYVPDFFSQAPLKTLSFSHRQIGMAPEGWDTEPGLTSVQVYADHEFRYWGGPSSGALGAKYAEYREYPEYDSLYEWPRKGHVGVTNKTKSFDLIKPKAIKVQNVGLSNVYLSQLEFEVIPEKAKVEDLNVFTPLSNFGDHFTMKGRRYGGGQALRGTFPNAIVLSGKNQTEAPQLPYHYKINKNQLAIKLPANTKLSYVDIMCGDSHPDMRRNINGGWGKPGNADVTVSIYNTTTQISRVLIKNRNVPPEGVISAYETENSLQIKEDDLLVISNRPNKSPLYIMAIKIGLN